MKRLNFSMTVAMLSIFCVGCVSHSMWVDERDKMVGTKFDPSWNVGMARIGVMNRYKASVHQDDEVAYYRMDQESPNIRYFIQWTPHCRYSLLVDPNGTILSWRFEATKDPGRSCVIH
ncbi:hypothetical protein E6C76_16215 [Pseudothauera nasutitermitis]|uniref:Uncharacterized protein n=1 Tax=Pseudothauera nasutitermitis TaxID=2565930 RepID=A0A4S4ASG3_9RHOO|nr:hypothetical protein [Pseudothauera nasutitermitis]THF62815.1 hypothetical protein E6C76_16215 [Pseudothauera nasutitermitis]